MCRPRRVGSRSRCITRERRTAALRQALRDGRCTARHRCLCCLLRSGRRRGKRYIEQQGSLLARCGRLRRRCGIGLPAVMRQVLAAWSVNHCRIASAAGLRCECRGSRGVRNSVLCLTLPGRCVRLGFGVFGRPRRGRVRSSCRFTAVLALRLGVPGGTGRLLRLPGARQGVGKARTGVGLSRYRGRSRCLGRRRGRRGQDGNDQRHGGGSSSDIPIQSKTCASETDAAKMPRMSYKSDRCCELGKNCDARRTAHSCRFFRALTFCPWRCCA